MTEFEHYQIEAVSKLTSSIDSLHSATGKRIAEHYERLQKRQDSELAQIRKLRRDLQRLPTGHPLRQQIAREIYAQVHFHLSNALRTARRLIEDATGATNPDTTGSAT